MSKHLYEKVDEQKLNMLLNCSNLSECDDDNVRTLLDKYSKLKNSKNGRKIMYYQKNMYGRYSCKYGAQTFKRNVRKFLFGDTHLDIDIVNCHPVILQQLFEKYNIYCKQLVDYNTNRKKYLEDNGIKDKTVLLKAINTENVTSETKLFTDVNKVIYESLLPLLLKEECNRNRLKSLTSARKKEKNDFNHKGSFISLYLQNIENDILMCMCDYVQEQGFVVSSYIYDGFMIEKHDSADEAFLLRIEQHVEQKLQWKVKLAFESLETDWAPQFETIHVIDDNIPTGEELDIEFVQSFKFTDENQEIDSYKVEQFVTYLNNFVCMFDDPLCYGFRRRKNDDYKFVNPAVLADRIGSNIKYWKYSNKSLKYSKCVFIVDKEHPQLKGPVYNLYKRPPQQKPSGTTLAEICPELYDYLYRLIVSSSKDNYVFLEHYFAKMVQVGKTEVSVVLLGDHGIGKSTFGFICALLVGNDEMQYASKYDSYSDLENKFNGDAMTNIVTVIEELPTDVGTYHKFQNKLKTLTTERFMMFEKKGIDRFKGESLNNFILNTNGLNPVNPTDQNRRYPIFEVSNEERRNREYFGNLRKAVRDNIEQVRWYFDHYVYNDDVFSMYVKTDAERDLVALNTDPAELFFREELDDVLAQDDSFENVYESYKDFFYRFKTHGKVLNKQYFSAFLKRNNYSTYRKGGSRTTCVKPN